MSLASAPLRCFPIVTQSRSLPASVSRSSVQESLSVGTFQRKLHNEHAGTARTLKREPTNNSDDAFMEGRTVVVVGAGPAGSCAAMALANAGASVAVYEMRSEDTFVQDEGEPYAIVLEQRGLSALLNAGFLDADFHGSTYLGSVRVGTDGSCVSFQAESDALACERRELAESLRKHAAASNPAKIAFKFGYQCVGGDLEKGEITFKEISTGKLTPVSFDLLIGADGHSSRVRDLLEDQVPEFTVNSERSGRVLHSFTGLSPHHEIVLEPCEWRDAEESDDGRSLILWTSRTPGITLSMHRRPDGTFSGVFGGSQTVFEALDNDALQVAAEHTSNTADSAASSSKEKINQLHASSNEETGIDMRKREAQEWIQAWQNRSRHSPNSHTYMSIEDKARAETYKNVLVKAFAGLPEDWADAISQQAAESSFVAEPDSIKCSQLHGPRTVLIGDAAHSAAPVLGQGANAALEDVSVLVDTLDPKHTRQGSNNGSIGANGMRDVSEFTRARKRDVHALIDLNRYMVGATELGPFAALAFLPLLVHVTFGQAVSALPWVGQPAVTRISQGIPYSKVVRSIVRDFTIFVCCLVAIIFALVFAR